MAKLDEGWDSYGGERLSANAAGQFIRFVQDFSYAIQSEPRLALTPAGGVMATWRSRQAEIELEFDPVGGGSVLWQDAMSDEWEGSIGETAQLDKWLWLASAED